ncbi:MAG: hypothetical protein J6K75_09060 [Erysipelotrichaceae bacterium]|nr:hypothetical protein [Erysipelotrichaceae bacterium]
MNTNEFTNKVVEVVEKMSETTVEGYKKIENGVVEGYKKVEDKFTEVFLDEEGNLKMEAWLIRQQVHSIRLKIQ